MGGRGCLHKGEHKNKAFTRRTHPPVSKPVNLTQNGEEFLKFLFYFYKYSLLCEIRADRMFPFKTESNNQPFQEQHLKMEVPQIPASGGGCTHVHRKQTSTFTRTGWLFPWVSCVSFPHFWFTFNKAPPPCSVQPPTFTLAEWKSERDEEKERERGREREEWEEGRKEILVLTDRNQWYTIDT